MLNPNFTPFPVLTTTRLVLRKTTLEDALEVFFLRSDATVNKFIKRTLAVNIQDAKDWIEKILQHEEKNESINWSITLKGEEKLVGVICLWNIEREDDLAEVGYSLHPDYFGKGLMTEALLAVNEYGFQQLLLQRIDAYTQKNNLNSIKMLKRQGFKRNLEFEKSYKDQEELEYNSIYTLKRQ